MFLELILIFCFPAAMCLAASMDFFTMTIPNRISLFLLGLFLLLAPFLGLSFPEVGMHLLAGFSMLLVSIVFFYFGWIGGGDAKIFAVASLWFGFEHLLEYVVFASLLGGLLTLGLLSVRKIPLPAFLARQEWALRLHDANGGIPYGIALGAAALIVYPETSWMKMALIN
ncbi:MAG: A24 family peptidase [Methyloligellaceae bacterium]